MFFILLLALVTLVLAGSAAYFSVWGMAQLFTGAFIPVIIMGTAMEAGKLMAASYLYRCWNETGYFLRAYMIAAIFIVMVVTSGGIAGFLTAAYQKDTLPLNETTELIDAYASELAILEVRKAEIDSQIAALPPTYITAKQRMLASFKDEIERVNPRVEFLTVELQRLRVDAINIESKIGPIMFIAKVVGLDPNDAVLYFILLLILVFDPLAVALTIATNIAIRKRLDAKKKPVVENITEDVVMGVSQDETKQSHSLESFPELASMVEQFKNRQELNRKLREV